MLGISRPTRKASKEILDTMAGFHFVESIESLIVSTLHDLLVKSSLKPSVVNNEGKHQEDLEKKFDAYIKKLKIRNRILKDLKDHVYYGHRVYYIKDDVLYKIDNSDTSKIIFQGNDLVGVKLADADMMSEENSKKVLKSEEVAVFMYDPVTIKELKLNDQVQQELGLSKDMPKFVVVAEGYQGRGIFDACIYRIYQILLKEFQADLLCMKQTLQSDIVMANVNMQDQNAIKVGQTINNIEAALNFSDFTYSSKNPLDLLTRIVYYFTHQVKVVPSLPGIAGFDKINHPDNQEKRSNLLAEIVDSKKETLNEVGIPEELFSGQSNKWEVLSRSSRFVTLIANLLAAEADMVINVCKSKFKEELRDQEYTISLAINSSNIILNNTMQNQSDILQRKISNYVSIIDGTSKLADGNPNIDGQKLITYIKQQIAMIDPDANDFINETYTKASTDLVPGMPPSKTSSIVPEGAFELGETQ